MISSKKNISWKGYVILYSAILSGITLLAIFQTPNLVPFLTARENILFPLELVGITGHKARDRSTELLEYMEVAYRSNYLPAFLSGGEQQRVSVTRALANRPN